jgi:hypothetical protein
MGRRGPAAIVDILSSFIWHLELQDNGPEIYIHTYTVSPLPTVYLFPKLKQRYKTPLSDGIFS